MIAPFFVRGKVPFQHIGKEKDLKDGKHNKQFKQDDYPQFSAPGHVSKPLVIEFEDFFYHTF
jgi:hypothetical protein